MRYAVRADLVAQDLGIPDARHDEHYTDDYVRSLTFVAWVDDSTYEDGEDGTVAKFHNAEGDEVYLYSIDLDYINEGEQQQ